MTTRAGAGVAWLKDNINSLLFEQFVQLHPTQVVLDDFKDKNNLSLEDFKSLLTNIDKQYKAPIPTAQMARQAGSYLGAVFNQSTGFYKVRFLPT